MYVVIRSAKKPQTKKAQKSWFILKSHHILKLFGGADVENS